MEQHPPTSHQTTTTSAGYEATLKDEWPAMQPLDALRLAIGDTRLKAMFDHWHQARGDKRMPAWNDIDPLQVKHLLPHMWSLRYDRGGHSFTGRLSGEEINTIFGKSLRHTRIEHFFAAQDVPWIRERCLRVISTPCIILVSGPVYAYAGHYGSGTRIMMPLGEDHAHGDEVIGVTIYELNPPSSEIEHFQPVEHVAYFSL